MEKNDIYAKITGGTFYRKMGTTNEGTGGTLGLIFEEPCT